MQISGIQMFWLMSTMEIGMTLLLTFAPTIQIAKQDAWISVFIAGILTIGITFVAGKVSLLHPRQTLIQYSQSIMGKWLGKIIVIPYFIMWYSVTPAILRESIGFIHITLFNKTPMFVLVLGILSVIVYATWRGGIQGIARCSEFMGPVIFLMLLITIVLEINACNWHQLLPVYGDSSVLSIMKGMINPFGFLGESIMIMMIMPFMTTPQIGPSRAMWGVGIAALFILIAMIITLMTFGPTLSARMWYPFFSASQFINLMGFLQNVDVIVVTIWIFSLFIKLSLYLFILSYGTAQWFHIKNWKNVLWFIAPTVFFITMLPPNLVFVSVEYPQKIWNPYIMPLNLVIIPLLFWVVGSIRERGASA